MAANWPPKYQWENVFDTLADLHTFYGQKSLASQVSFTVGPSGMPQSDKAQGLFSAFAEGVLVDPVYWITPQISGPLLAALEDIDPDHTAVQPTDLPSLSGTIVFEHAVPLPSDIDPSPPRWLLEDAPHRVEHAVGLINWSLSDQGLLLMWAGPVRIHLPDGTVSPFGFELFGMDASDLGRVLSDSPWAKPDSADTLGLDKYYTWVGGDHATRLQLDVDPELHRQFRVRMGSWVRSLFYSVVHFSVQKLATLEPRPVPRHAARRLARLAPEVRPQVQVITLRAREQAHRAWEESGGHHLETRHIRRAHWHGYWVGPQDGPRRLEPRWVEATVVGPKGAPLVGGVKVFSVSR